MKKLIMLRGLQGSGKSTWATAWVNEDPGHRVRVNKDSIRQMLGPAHHSKFRENLVLKIRDASISAALDAGQSVVVDDTNFGKKHEPRLREIAKQNGAEFEVNESFLEVPLEECIRRDLIRPNSVGERVIRDTARRFLGVGGHATASQPYEGPETAPRAIIVDLDGTLALIGDRNPYDASNCHEVDVVNEAVRDVVISYLARHPDRHVIILSGRSDRYREQTDLFLEKVFDPAPPHHPRVHGPFMRRNGDTRKDSVLKLELFNEHVRDRYRIDFVLDDRDQVVEMWRDTLGLTCMQVAYGSF